MKQRRQHVGLSVLDAEGLHCFRTFMVMIARDTENPAEDAFKPDAGKHRFPSLVAALRVIFGHELPHKIKRFSTGKQTIPQNTTRGQTKTAPENAASSSDPTFPERNR